MPLPRAIDSALSGYVFYPEAEWSRFGYRPPENEPLLGAWRDPDGSVFAFLLAPDSKKNSQNNGRLLLYVSGAKQAVNELGAKVAALKTVLAKSEGKEIRVLHAEHRMKQENKSPAVGRLLKLIGIVTVLVNAFSLYLRKLPPPEFPTPSLQMAYSVMIVILHFSSLILLFLVTLIAILYVLRYGILMMRRF